MIIGDPYKFSIFVKEIKEWNEAGASFHNGVLLLCIDSDLFPQQVVTATLSREIPLLRNKLENYTINIELFNMVKENAFVNMYNLTFPKWDPTWENQESIENDYSYFLSPTSLSDLGYHVYVVSNGSQVRILAAKLHYILEESTHDLNNLIISEGFIDIDEIKKIINELDKVLE